MNSCAPISGCHLGQSELLKRIAGRVSMIGYSGRNTKREKE